MNLWVAKLANRLLALRHIQLRRRNVWFFEHYYCVARHILATLKSAMGSEALRDARVLEIGCGDGITALAVSQEAMEVQAVDLTRAFDGLSNKVSTLLEVDSLPSNLHFHQVKEGKPMPFTDASFDAVYSWSVFEHVANVYQVLSDTHRILKSNGLHFIQIAPLYHSAFGSHLRRLGIKPWEHLLLSDKELAVELKKRTGAIVDREKDWLFEAASGESYVDYLLSEYQRLNKITTGALVSAAKQAGFTIEQCQVGSEPFLRPHPDLQRRFDKRELLERELWLLLRKP